MDRGERIRYLVECYRHEDASLLHAGGLEGVDELYRRSQPLGHWINYYKKTSRLMAIARDEILNEDRDGRDFPSGVVWWADSLDSSKGRMSRAWWAPLGGIYLCVAIFPELIRENRGLYSLAAGLAVTEVFRAWGLNARARWINDVLVNDRKVAGILAESVWCPDAEQEYILFGMGINVNISGFPSYLPCASSLELETGHRWSRISLGAHILARLSLRFAELHKWEADNAGESGVQPPLNPAVNTFRLISGDVGRDVVYGHDVESAPEVTGAVRGIEPDGSLVILTEGGRIMVNSGEIRYILSGKRVC